MQNNISTGSYMILKNETGNSAVSFQMQVLFEIEKLYLQILILSDALRVSHRKFSQETHHLAQIDYTMMESNVSLI